MKPCTEKEIGYRKGHASLSMWYLAFRLIVVILALVLCSLPIHAVFLEIVGHSAGQGSHCLGYWLKPPAGFMPKKWQV